MAHFAQLDDSNTVIQVIVVNNEVMNNEEFPASEPVGIAFCQSLLGPDTKWRQTSYNSNFRKHFAGTGFVYDATRDAFIPPKPFMSWVLNEDSCLWEAPIPCPQDGKFYEWDEGVGNWVERN